jgi:predicted DCC family thiol-disulfide oxidoreductase YuxK
VRFYYDSDCGICSALARWATRNTNASLHGIQASTAQLLALGVTPDRLLSAAYAESKGELLSGARAITALLARARSPWLRLLGRAAELPIARNAADLVYRAVASNRACISRLLKL